MGRVVNRVGNYSTFDRRGRYFLIRNFLTRLDRITRVVVVLFHWIFKMTFPPDVEFCNVFQDVSACLASECGSGFSWFNLSVFEDFSFISRQKSKKLDSCSFHELSSCFSPTFLFLLWTNRIYFFPSNKVGECWKDFRANETKIFDFRSIVLARSSGKRMKIAARNEYDVESM